LAASGLHPKSLEEADTFEEYCELLMVVMEVVPVDERVLHVGHINKAGAAELEFDCTGPDW
jgi:hypothetical protein